MNYDTDADCIMSNDSTDYRELKQSIMANQHLHRYQHNFNKIKHHDATSLLRLPTEILLHIFHYLERRHLFALLTVCREIADLIIEILWFRPNMQDDRSFHMIRDTMKLSRQSTHWDYRQYIKRLNLSFMTKLVDNQLLSLFVGCPKLERLTLVNCTKLTHEPIAAVLQHCDRLQSIDLTGIAAIHDDIIDALATNCPRLQGLYAPGCKYVSEEAIVRLLTSCPMLKRVKFNGSHKITDVAIEALHANCKSLVELDLHNCPNVTDEYLRLIFRDLTQLREFRISNAAGVTDRLFELVPLDTKLEKLRIVDISGCNAITDRMVERLVQAAPKLRNVVLSKCMQITDASLRAFSHLGRSLHYIHLGHCGLITDFGVASMLRSCHRIQYIDLACCSQLTDWTLVELANLPKLRRIGLVKCNLITDLGILELVRRRGEQDCLERVHLSYCTNLTIEPINLLLKSCPRLTHLSLTGVPAFLRKDITQFCRDPPPDFTEQQRNSFCVFSGNGVNKFREHLTRVMEERNHPHIDNDMNLLFQERRRRQFLNGGGNIDDDEMHIWAQRGLGIDQAGAAGTAGDDFAEINRQIQNITGPPNEDIREHFQRLIREHHQNRRMIQNRQQTPGAVEFATGNPQFAPQIIQPAVFPNGELAARGGHADDEDEEDDDGDVNMESVPRLFPPRQG
ncbi:hypothetical protein DICA1_D20032 [Diutina catenulata]